jgi:prepilin-type N-terminal cleavage/methylation domain-containing protein
MSRQFVEGAARRRRPFARFEEGFTVLELVVVIAIISVLLAVSLPGFTAAKASAQEHAAQADLRTALLAANSAFISTTDQSFGSVSQAVLASAEPSLRWSTTELTSGPGTIAALNGCVTSGSTCSGGDPWAIGLAVDAGNGTCWYAFQADNDAPWYGAARRSASSCDAKDAGPLASAREF